MPQVSIGNRIVGTGCQPFIVAEVGINHNGELARALAMIESARAAGVDAVKFQTFQASEFVGDPTQTFTYFSQGKEVTEPMLTMFQRCELAPDDWVKIKRRCDDLGILFLSTPQNRSDLDILLKLDVCAIKVGSDDFTNLPLLADYATTGLPLIVSCGMSDLSEVHCALETIGTLDGYPTVLMLCTSQYPTPPEDVNLLKLRTLSQAFPMVPLGFSDHTQGPLAAAVAVAFGAVFFEKHFTLDKNLPGPDHWFSENPEGLREWTASIRRSAEMMGSAVVRPTIAERKMRVLARRSIVAIRDIAKDEPLTSVNIGLRRPGNGLPPAMYDRVVGSRARRALAKGELLTLGDFG